jgi:hypothetical protein
LADRMTQRPRQDINAGLPAEKDELGRFVTAYNPETAILIVERLAMGETLTEICAEPGMPARSTFNRWVVKYPELARAYNAARIISAQSLEDEALVLARRAANGKNMNGTEIRGLEVAMNQFRWSAVRRDPEKFAEKQAINVKVPVQINTILDLGESGGGAATAEHPNIYSLHATVSVEAPEDPDRPVVAQKSPRGKTILVPRVQPDTLALAKPRPRKKNPAPESDSDDNSV